jgi:hypothetical protein
LESEFSISGAFEKLRFPVLAMNCGCPEVAISLPPHNTSRRRRRKGKLQFSDCLFAKK